MKDVKITRRMSDPPEEVYEAALREATQMLAEAGHRAAFLLVVATSEGDDYYHTAFGVSSGSDRIPVDDLLLLTSEWIQEQL